MISADLRLPPRDASARRRAHRRYGRKAWKQVRLQVLSRDLWRCVYCGADATIADHVVRPEDGGAEYDPANLVAACQSCNIRRHHGNLGYRTGSPSPGAPPRNPLVSPFRAAGQPPSLRVSGDPDKFIPWAMSLPLVNSEPKDHGHGWGITQVHHHRKVFGVCPPSCTHAPVRWWVP